MPKTCFFQLSWSLVHILGMDSHLPLQSHPAFYMDIYFQPFITPLFHYTYDARECLLADIDPLSGIHCWMHFTVNMIGSDQWVILEWRELSEIHFTLCDSRLLAVSVPVSPTSSIPAIRKQRISLFFILYLSQERMINSLLKSQYPFCLFSSLKRRQQLETLSISGCVSLEMHICMLQGCACLWGGNGGSGKLDWNHWAEGTE